jgi:uncharacterized protein (TIRG00374 family)
VAYKLDWEATLTILMNVQWSWLGLAFAIYIFNYILRTSRFQALIYTQKAPFLKLMGVTSLYGMFNYLLPAKTGELSYIVLLNRRMHISLVETTSTLLASRYLDFAAIAVILPLILIEFWIALPLWLIYSSLGFCISMVIFTIILYWLGRRRIEPTDRRENKRASWMAKIWKVLIDLLDGLITIYKRGNLLRLMVITIGIWMCVYTSFYLIALSLGYSMSYYQAVVISIIMIPMTLLPFQGFANLGTHEIGWVAAFAIFGEPESMALTIAFGSHVILLAFVLILGICSLFTLIPGVPLPESERIK